MDRVYRQKSLESAIIYGCRRYDLIGPQSYTIISLQVPLGSISFINYGRYVRYSEYLCRVRLTISFSDTFIPTLGSTTPEL
jgi:hypothetical protein